MSASKVAPLKHLRLPRLELCRAVILVHLMRYVQQTIKLNVPVHLLSDSTDTLDWIKGHPTRWKTFIANWVSEIQTTLPSVHWHYVPSASNPTDCASRIIPAKNLASFSHWWKGPDRLTSSSIWPVRPPSRKKNKVDSHGDKSYKGYIAVFVCCSTRAVHLEVVSDYTAKVFLAAYTIFVSRQGIIKTLSSDQGTNFIGVDANLREMFTSDSKQSKFIASVLAADSTQRRFNPPGALHFDGLWGAAVKSSKHYIRRVLGDRTLTFEEMSTFLSQVEACLNSRHLQARSDDPEDLSALTPGHFLIGEPLNNIPKPNLLEVLVTRLTHWQLVQQMQQHFWHRLSSDYLKELQPRSKWRSTCPSMEIDDLALIRDENLPPTKWALGRFIDLHPGSDGYVRVVTLRTKGGVLERPIVRLCLLPRAVKEAV